LEKEQVCELERGNHGTAFNGKKPDGGIGGVMSELDDVFLKGRMGGSVRQEKKIIEKKKRTLFKKEMGESSGNH